MKKIICLLLFAALLLAGCGKETAPATTGSSAAGLEEPTGDALQIPDFTVLSGDSQPVKLSDYIGKPIVLNFWASWCGPCKAEMPAFQEAYEELGSQVQFLMVNVGERMDEGAAFIASAGYTFPVLFDVNNDASYAYQITSIPASFFIDASGNIVDAHVGTMSAGALSEAIAKITN